MSSRWNSKKMPRSSNTIRRQLLPICWPSVAHFTVPEPGLSKFRLGKHFLANSLLAVMFGVSSWCGVVPVQESLVWGKRVW